MHKFIYENDYTEQEPRKITIEVGMDADLTEMLDSFESYLRAVGYNFDGVVDIHPEHSFDDTLRSFSEQTSEPLPYGYPAYNYDDVKVTFGDILQDIIRDQKEDDGKVK